MAAVARAGLAVLLLLRARRGSVMGWILCVRALVDTAEVVLPATGYRRRKWEEQAVRMILHYKCQGKMATVAGQSPQVVSLNCCELRHSDSFIRYGPGWATYVWPTFFQQCSRDRESAAEETTIFVARRLGAAQIPLEPAR